MEKFIKKVLLLSLLFVAFFSLVGCDIFDGSSTINQEYNLSTTIIEEYTSISSESAALVVTGIVMPATVEIECRIDYSYTRTGFNGWSSYEQSVNNYTISQATGFFINEDGYLMTNAHVITLEDYESYKNFKYEKIEIVLNYADSDITFKASIVAYDKDLDLAILKVNEDIKNLQYVTFFNLTSPSSEKYETSEAIKLLYGEVAIAIGNANGYGLSVTQGVVSAPIRYFENNGSLIEAIQTDAAINAGNSGGPLANKFGSVIGMNSFKVVTETSENLGYAIPANVIMKYINSLNKNIKYYYTNYREYNISLIQSNI